jgi:Helicase conserved C-terminal domain
MSDRARMIAAVRAEIVGPSQPLDEPTLITFADRLFSDPLPNRRGAVTWRPSPDELAEEVLYFERETPHRKYGAGLLHPEEKAHSADPAVSAAAAADTLGVDLEDVESADPSGEEDSTSADDDDDTSAVVDDFEVTSLDVRHPSTIGVSCCVTVGLKGSVAIRLPSARMLAWQPLGAAPVRLNGRYEQCSRSWKDEKGITREAPAWRRHPAVTSDSVVRVSRAELESGNVIQKPVPTPANSPLRLRVDVFPRPLKGSEDTWLVTIVLRNVTPLRSQGLKECILYQTLFEVTVEGGVFSKYPESERPFSQLDEEEQSLVLLYRESATWGIGHGCAAGWDAQPDKEPSLVFADVMPTVETPSMTPDIVNEQGQQIRLSMRDMAELSDDGASSGWTSLDTMVRSYRVWIGSRAAEAGMIEHPELRAVAERHLHLCQECLTRIEAGIALLRSQASVRSAFRLANVAMLLQQIATKQLKRRPLELTWLGRTPRVKPSGSFDSPWSIFEGKRDSANLGTWRAFQMAFLLMQLGGMSQPENPERETVDLIWFPTGGGKTEAYLGVMAFYMFHERSLMRNESQGLPRDGTNVLMRYTLRMLTTQQFQRAASLICAMEYLRRSPESHTFGEIAGERFSLALWIGSDGAPNKIADATSQLSAYRNGTRSGNPLVLTECPWCRSEIGRVDGATPSGLKEKQWNALRVAGVADTGSEGPLLHCPDAHCDYGRESHRTWLPVEVIDERIYKSAPSLVIATADKFALLAYRPLAGALFGRERVGAEMKRVRRPPGLIVQDELHLIAGPLGTMYGLYEGVIERLCSYDDGGAFVVPKIIASTATIRGAADQVRSLYARIDSDKTSSNVRLFPSPGLRMGDSFFGVYARRSDGSLEHGRLYLGVHATEYGSVLTTQVRAFSAALCEAGRLDSAIASRDPWWTLLVFYNSLRELGGAKTLFDADIRSRLKFLQNRQNVTPSDRRNLRIVEELTSRLSQAEIVGMLDSLSTSYQTSDNRAFDACLASSIIEVGVDIDRLSLMGIVGQPKTTAQYIQVSGRVGRRWWERPGLILMVYSPAKSRDRSHFEQFHSYHRRLYERVEPTSATPFAPAALQRGFAGALLTWARQMSAAGVSDSGDYRDAVAEAYEMLCKRCEVIQVPEDLQRSLDEMLRRRDELLSKWARNPQEWERFPPSTSEEYLMLWPGQFASYAQRQNGLVVPSSMRQVDGSAELAITQGYANLPVNQPEN